MVKKFPDRFITTEANWWCWTNRKVGISSITISMGRQVTVIKHTFSMQQHGHAMIFSQTVHNFTFEWRHMRIMLTRANSKEKHKSSSSLALWRKPSLWHQRANNAENYGVMTNSPLTATRTCRILQHASFIHTKVKSYALQWIRRKDGIL